MESERTVFFPDADDERLQPFARAFVRLMFAHSEFEHRVSHLLGIITGEPDFGERPGNGMSAKDRPKIVRKLCDKHAAAHPGGLPERNDIAERLRRAIPLCKERNRLAHGVWWQFNIGVGVVTVRAATIRRGEEQHRDFTVAEIAQLADAFHDLEVDLWKLQTSIEARHREPGWQAKNQSWYPSAARRTSDL